jgi:hypothetical protein
VAEHVLLIDLADLTPPALAGLEAVLSTGVGGGVVLVAEVVGGAVLVRRVVPAVDAALDAAVDMALDVTLGPRSGVEDQATLNGGDTGVTGSGGSVGA